MISLFKKLTITITFLLSIITNGQSLNNYEYVVVPEQFEFQRSPHDYEVNKLTEFLFNKYNFKAFIKGELLPDGITVCDVLETSITGGGFLNTKLTLKLLNCKGEVIYTSEQGTSRKKDYKQAYHEAIRMIFKDPRLKLHKYKEGLKPKTKNYSAKEKEILTVDSAKPESVKPQKAPVILKGKRTTRTPAKFTGPSIIFKLRQKEYVFQPIGKNYVIEHDNETIGEARLNPDNVSYTLKADALSGTGVFDDYGNFELTRINPLTQKQIKDVLARTN